MKSFTDDTGPTQMPPGTSTPIKFFEQIFDDAFFDGFVEATNLNAAAKSPPPADAPARGPYATSDTHWLPTTAKEMRAFFGINMAMGITDMPEYKDYWSADPLLRNDYIASIMPRIRYEKLCQYMHCSVPQREDHADKLAKVRPIITLCERQFKARFHPSCNVSIDEALIRYDGRLSWKQYMPKKPVKWGFKLWCLCDSSTGYCVAFSVYTGASNDDNNGMDLGYRVIMRLMRGYLSANRCVFADNYFTSVHLAKDLLDADTYLCGTTRASRRDFPNGLAQNRVRRGESEKWVNDDGVLLCKWHDKRDVYMIATGDAGDDTVRPTRRDHEVVDMSVPRCVLRYNKSMGGVDHLDQMRSYYSVGRSGRKWWKYLFWGLIGIGSINACTLWRLCNRPLPSNERLFSLKTFKVRLIHELADPFINERLTQPAPPVARVEAAYTVSDDAVAGHPLVRIEGRKRACRLCSNQKRRRLSGRTIESSFGCLTCNIHLCKEGCFAQYHQ